MAPPGLPPLPPHAGQQITMVIIPALGEIATTQPFKQPNRSWHDFLRTQLDPHFDERWEHVAVLYKGERRDMFVGETSSINGRHIRNVRATAIYRANAIEQYRRGNSFDLPKAAERLQALDPERFPAISGPAVLFPDVIVWR